MGRNGASRRASLETEHAMVGHTTTNGKIGIWPIAVASLAAPFLRHVFLQWAPTPYAVGLSFAVPYALLSPFIPRSNRRYFVDNWHWLPRGLAFGVLTGGITCLAGFLLY